MDKDSLSSDGYYILMHQPASYLPSPLSVLETVRPLQFRFFDPESAGVDPSTFLESSVNADGDIELQDMPGRAFQKRIGLQTSKQARKE